MAFSMPPIRILGLEVASLGGSVYEILAKKVMDHLKSAGLDDVIGPPFFCERHELALLDDANWREFFRQEIQLALTQYPPSLGALQHISVPKGRYTFRSIAYMTIADTIKFTAAAFSLGETIEPKRLDANIVFSNRFSTADLTLDKSRYDQFRARSKELSDPAQFKIKVVTDIANFYDRLNLHKLENILLEIRCDRQRVKMVIHALMHWSKQQSFGLPVGSDGTRLLAEAMLINVDNELKQRGITFVRYVDDFRLFSATQQQAYEAMQVLDDALRREGLFVNSGKTRLVDLQREAEEAPERQEAFQPVDVNAKEEVSTRVKTRYGSRIAKFYRFPGKETVERLQKVDLAQSLEAIRDPSTDEDKLKDHVKAAVYAPKPTFEPLQNTLNIYPHLIPYCVDAIVKEYTQNLEKFDDNFLKAATIYFRKCFEAYARNDYFRIQCARCLCAIDDDCGEFLGLQLRDMNAASEVVFAQLVLMLGQDLSRNTLLALLEKFGSYGSLAKTALVRALTAGGILSEDERRPLQKNLMAAEQDKFIKQLLKL